MSLRRPPVPARREPPGRSSGLDRASALRRRAPLRAVSVKRQAENRVRRAMAGALWPERPACAWPGCTSLADDVHEPLTRARGGPVTDPGNAVPLCRPHHDHVTFTRESGLGDAYEHGLLRHSWDAAREGRAA